MFRAKSFNRTKLSYKTQTENKTKKLDLDENGKFYQYIVQGFSCQRLFVTWISIFFLLASKYIWHFEASKDLVGAT